MTQKEYEYLANLSKSLPSGDVIVAGTESGDDVRTIKKANRKRNIVVIDSFEGLADPVEEDVCESTMVAGECDVGGLEAYLQKFKDARIRPPKEIYKMWITKETLAVVPKRQVALLFLDLDHYQPTKDCLDIFKGWVVKDGVILVHDYDFIRCPGIKKCCDEFFSDWEKVEETGFGIHYIRE
jgi:hypothetical protein